MKIDFPRYTGQLLLKGDRLFSPTSDTVLEVLEADTPGAPDVFTRIYGSELSGRVMQTPKSLLRRGWTVERNEP